MELLKFILLLIIVSFYIALTSLNLYHALKKSNKWRYFNLSVFIMQIILFTYLILY